MKKLLVILLVLLGLSYGQRPQYRDFDWSYIQTLNFDVYYYDDVEIAKYVADKLEESHKHISKHIQWKLQNRLSVIIYNSHSDFQQTNVVQVYMREGIGGVTEAYKNRIVIPFEGSYKNFDRVITHELVHGFLNDMMYGKNAAVKMLKNRVDLPNYMNEGLAEYLAEGWSTEDDMYMRDLILQGTLPTVPQLSRIPYHGGQSFWNYIVDTYGKQKISELLHSIRKHKKSTKAIKEVFDMDFDDLTREWRKYVKKQYFPEIAKRDELEDIAYPLTNHIKTRNYFNTAPRISPDGDQIVYMTDRNMYADVYVMNTFEDSIQSKKGGKRIIKGNKDPTYEELKWLQPGFSWSPSGDKIVLAAQSSGSDVLYIIDSKTGKILDTLLEFEFGAIFTPSWSPDGKHLVFVGNSTSSSDLWIYNFELKKLSNLTNDIYSDSEPSWYPSSKNVVYASERDGQTEIYFIDIFTRIKVRLTDSPSNETFPFYTSEGELLYVSDLGGVNNIWRGYNSITNVLTGVYFPSLSKDDETLVFSGFSNSGWDVYKIHNPLDKLNPIEIPKTKFSEVGIDTTSDFIVDAIVSGESVDYSKWVFSPDYDYKNNKSDKKKKKKESLIVSRDSLGQYISHKYKTKFSADYVNSGVSYSTLWGYSGMNQLLYSDILGDKYISLIFDVIISSKDSDFQLQYANLKHKIDYSINVQHIVNRWISYYDYTSIRLRNIGVGGSIYKPVNKFSTYYGGLNFSHIIYEEMIPMDYWGEKWGIIDQRYLNVLVPNLGYSWSNASWYGWGPVDGQSINVSFFGSPKLKDNGIEFGTLIGDFRKYFFFKKEYSLALRSMVGTSFGSDKQIFLLGGTPMWIGGSSENGTYRTDAFNEMDEDLLKSLYFSVYATPIRGYRFAERFGSNVALFNIEYRFPFIYAMAFGFPTKFMVGNISGHVFTDFGTAWDSWNNNDLTKYSTIESSRWVHTLGMGIKIPFILPWKLEVAWQRTGEFGFGEYSNPMYLISVGYDW